MADSILKKHQLDITVGVELNDAQRKATSAQIKNMASQWQDMLDDAIKKGIEDGARSASLRDVLTQFNAQLKAFKLEPLTITVDELQIMDKPIEHAAKLVIQKLGNSFKGGGLGNIISSEITDSLDVIGGAVDKIYQKMEQGAKKSAKNIAKSMAEIAEAADTYTTKKSMKQIDKAISSNPHTTKATESVKGLFEESRAAKKNGASWDKQYLADVNFVKNYKKVGVDNLKQIFGDQFSQVEDYYNRLAKVHQQKIIALNDILAQKEFVGGSTKNPTQYQFKGEPWAREKTLQEVKSILSGGLTVKDSSSGDNNGKTQPNLNTQKSSETPEPTKVKSPTPVKEEVKVDTNVFNKVLFDAIETLSTKLQGMYKQMFADDVDDDEFDKIANSMSALLKDFTSQFKFDNPKKIVGYLQGQSDNMPEWDSAKIHKTLSKQLSPEDPSWPRAEAPVIEDSKPEIIKQMADAHKEVAAAVREENEALEKKAELIRLINTFDKADNRKEKFAYLNMQTGEASEYIEGQYQSLSGNDIDNLRQKDGRTFDSTIHTHPYHVAAPSPDDLKTMYVKKHDEFKTHFIQAINEVFSIDFSTLTKDQVQEIYKNYKQNIKDFEKSDVISYRDLGIESIDINSIMQSIKEELLSLYPELQTAINSYIEDIRHTFQQGDFLSNDTETSRFTFDDKAATHFSDVTDDGGMEVAGVAEQLFEIATGEADAFQIKLKNIFEQTIRDLGYDVSQITKTYGTQEFIQQIQPNVSDGDTQKPTQNKDDNIETVDKSNTKSSASDADSTVIANLNTTLTNLVTALSQEKSDPTATINTEELGSVLHDGRPYLVDINGKGENDDSVNKVAIEAEDLKAVLASITFKIQDVSEKESVNSSIDQESINNLVGAIKTAITPQNDGDNKSTAPWAKEDTLRNITGKTLGRIANSIPKVDVKNLAKNDVLNRVAQATEAINGKISGKITGSIKDIAESNKTKQDAKKEQELKEHAAAVQRLSDEYKELGKLRAQRDAMPSSTERVALQQEIKAKGTKLRRQGAKLGANTDVMKNIADDAQAEEAAAIATRKHKEEYDKLIEKIKERNKEQEKLAGADKESRFAKDIHARVDGINNEIDLIQQKIKLTKEERSEVDKLNKKRDEAINDKINKKQDQDDAKKFREELKQARKDNNLDVANTRLNSGRKALQDLWVLDAGIDPNEIPEVVQLRTELTTLRTEYDRVNQAMLNGDSDVELADLEETSAAVAAKTAKLKELLAHYEKFKNGANIGTYVPGAADEEDQLRNAISQQFGGKAKIKGFARDASGFLTASVEVKEGARAFTEYKVAVEGTDKSIRALKGNTKQLPSFLDSVKRKLGEISQYVSAMSVISRAGMELRKGIQYVRDIDLALTELKKVTSETEETYDKFLDTASKTAAKVGSTIKDVISSTADWARLNI